jgi:hypothetical protein
MDKRVDIKLLGFLEPKTGMPKDMRINKFILLNFEKPDPLPTNESDEALILLRQLQSEELIEFIKGAAFYWIGNINNEQEQIIYWWDNVSGEDVYKITRKGINYLDQYRISQIASETNESVKSTNKWTLRIIGFALFVTIVNTYLTVIHNSDNEKYQLKTYIKAKQFLIDSLQSKLNQQQYLINHLLIPQNNKNRHAKKTTGAKGDPVSK